MKKERLNKILKELKIKDIMHKKIIKLYENKTICDAISYMIKYKINDILVTSANETPIGIISKDDLLGSYYIEFPTNTPIASIISSPVTSCPNNTSLNEALDAMAKHRILSLYVTEGNKIVGLLTYPDIIGTIYKFCFSCPKNRFQNHRDIHERFIKVKDVMSRKIFKISIKNSIKDAIEVFLNKESEIILVEKHNKPYGVITKTDLIRAYKHGILIDTLLDKVTKERIIFCFEEDSLIKALKLMIVTDVQNLIVFKSSDTATGFLSLKAAAQLRSGSCKACKSSRKIEKV